MGLTKLFKSKWLTAFAVLLRQYRWIITISALAVLCSLLVLSLLGDVRRSSRADRSVEHTLEVMIETQRIWSTIQTSEISSKDYLLNLNPESLLAYKQAIDQVTALLSGLRHMVQDSPEQQIYLAELEDAVKTRIALLNYSVESFKPELKPGAKKVLEQNSDESIKVIRQKVGEIIAKEQHLLSIKKEAIASFETRHSLTILAATFIAALTIAISCAAWLARSRGVKHLHEIEIAQTRLKLAQEAGEVGLWEWDSDNNFFWSSIQSKLHGITAKELPTLELLLSIVLPDDYQNVKQSFLACKESGKVLDIIYRVPFLNGEIAWLHTKGQALEKNGTLIGVTVDVSIQHERTALLEKINGDLENKVAIEVAARERAYIDLAQSRKMDALGQLTGGVAHDFNNLLQAISSSANMIDKKAGDASEVKRMIDVVKKAAERGTSLTKRMLAFARQQDLQPDTIDVKQLVHDMISMIERTLGPRIKIDTSNFSDDLWNTRADANQLELALLNLAVNSRDAMPNGGLLKISARNQNLTRREDALEQGLYLVIEVSDTGIGMDEITLSRAIEPFFTTKGIGKGTGLGLPMVHGLAAQSGGALKLKSKVGNGTVAEIWLPKANSNEIKLKQVNIETKPIAEINHEQISLKILLVDDDALVLDVAMDALEDLGHQVFIAASGEAALSMIQADFDFDLMVTDQSMPGITGMDLAIESRAIKPGMAVLLATGYSEFPLNSDVLDHAPLRKPYSQDELKYAIWNAMKSSNERNAKE